MLRLVHRLCLQAGADLGDSDGAKQQEQHEQQPAPALPARSGSSSYIDVNGAGESDEDLEL